MKTFALAALCFLALSTTVHAAQDADGLALRDAMVSRYDVTVPASLKGYEKTSLEGYTTVYRLSDNARVNNDQPGTLIFDAQNHLIAIGFTRPASDGVTVLGMDGLQMWHVNADITLAAK